MPDSKQLVTSFKRLGRFDKHRHALYADFKAPGSKNHEALISLINEKISKKMKLDPQLLAQNRGKAVGLMTGSLYKDEAINKIIAESVKEACSENTGLRNTVREELKEINESLSEKK